MTIVPLCILLNFYVVVLSQPEKKCPPGYCATSYCNVCLDGSITCTKYNMSWTCCGCPNGCCEFAPYAVWCDQPYPSWCEHLPERNFED